MTPTPCEPPQASLAESCELERGTLFGPCARHCQRLTGGRTIESKHERADGRHRQTCSGCYSSYQLGINKHQRILPSGKTVTVPAGDTPSNFDDRVRPLSRHHTMPRFATVILVIFLTCFSWVAEAARFGGRGGKIVQPRVRPIMAGGVGVKPPPSTGSAKKKVVEKPKVIRIPFSPFEYDMAQLHSTDLAFDMFWRSTPLL